MTRRVEDALRLQAPQAQNPTAQILNALLLGVLAWCVLLFTVDLPTDPHKLATGALETLLCLNSVAALVLLHKGALRAASLVYLCGSWAVYTVLIIFNGGIHSVAVVYYVVVPTSAAWLFGYRAAFGSTAICLASSLTMAVMEINGFHFPLYFPGRPLGIWDALVGALVLSAIPVARVLALSRSSETVLRQKQVHLEERTAELRQSEERFRKVFEEGPLGMAIVSPDSRILDVNESLCALLGYNPEEMKTLTIRDLTHPDDIAMDTELTRQVFAGEIPHFRIEKRFIKKTGEIVWADLAATLIKSAEGMPMYGLGMIEDITERKRAEAELHESEERFRTMADTAPVMIWVSDQDKRATFFNRAWLDFTGRTMEQELGTGWRSNLHPDDQSQALAISRSSFDARRRFQVEYRLRRADGEYRWLLVTGVPRYRNGEFTGFIGSCLDLTERKLMEERVRARDAEAFAMQKLESLGTLATGIAHDFNNLLGGVLAQADLAESELPAGSNPQNALKEIQNAAMRGSEIVRQLMTYAGKESNVLEPVDISATVNEMMGLVKTSISKHSALKVDLPDDLPAVIARSAQIRQILMNLVTNASEAIEDRDGVIRVNTKRVTVERPGAADPREGMIEGEYVQLEVSDNGRGMSSETKARIFEPFFSTKSLGRGLGLSMVHRIVQSLGGAIRVSSQLGEGTTFQILLPCAAEPVHIAPETRERADDALHLLPKGVVLVVEDEAALRLAIVKMLAKAGFTVFEAENASDAVRLLGGDASEVDLLLLDLTIPGRSSFEVLAEAQRTRPEVRVLLTSAYSEEMARAALRGYPVCGFIRKPFQLGEVAVAIRNAFYLDPASGGVRG